MFSRFLLIGGIGFLIDATLLSLLVGIFSWHQYSARAVSFAVAVTVTWLCNRRYAFAASDDAAAEYGRYLAIQIVGAVLNLAVFVGLVETWDSLAAIPVIPLAIGAAIALIFNFTAARFFVFARPAASAQSRNSEAIDASYPGRDNLEAMKHAVNYNQYLFDLVRSPASGGSIVDFGAGAGTFAIPMARAGHSVSCIEPDRDLADQLQRAGLTTYRSLDAIPDGSADFIYTLNVLEHIERDGDALRALASKLKPEGRLLVYVPAFQCLYSSMDSQVGHFRRYRKSTLNALLVAAGLCPRESRYVDSLGFFAALIFKLVGSDTGEISPASVRLYDRYAFPLSRMCDWLFSRYFGKNLVAIAAKANSR